MISWLLPYLAKGPTPDFNTPFHEKDKTKTFTIASNSDSLAKSEVCNQSLVFCLIDEKPLYLQ